MEGATGTTTTTTETTVAEGAAAARTEPEVCQFYLQGTCRFGEDCRNAHPAGRAPANNGGAKKKTSKKSKGSESPKEKRGMKTAMDVIKRIQWDADLPESRFKVGYVDRFVGIVEDNFSKFSAWGDIASAEYEALAIPQHRIEYFKYRGVKVWDKKARLDEVFGSTEVGSGLGILEFMNRIDRAAGNEEEEEEDAVAEDGDFEVIMGDSDEEEDEGAARKCTIPEEERSTHFLSIRITTDGIVDNALTVQRHIVEREEALSECCMKAGLFHVTICMLRLGGEAGEREMARATEELEPLLKSFRCRMVVEGLDTFGQRVLYAKIRPEPEEEFYALISAIQNRIAETSGAVTVSDKFGFTPHMTLCKVNRPISRVRKSKYLPSALYEKYAGLHFGVQEVDNLQLCIIDQATRFDGFYKTIADVAREEEEGEG